MVGRRSDVDSIGSRDWHGRCRCFRSHGRSSSATPNSSSLVSAIQTPFASPLSVRESVSGSAIMAKLEDELFLDEMGYTTP